MVDKPRKKARVERVPQVHMLSFGTKSVEGSHVQEDDPFDRASMYEASSRRRRLLVPPLGGASLRMLAEHVDESNILGQCIDAYETNIDGFGHRYELVVKEDEVQDKDKAEVQAEQDRLEMFFEYAYADGSFVELRKKMRRDVESTGMGYWEVIRDPAKGTIKGLNHLPAHTVRMTPLDPAFVTIDEKRRSKTEIMISKLTRRFRVYCQLTHASGKQETTWFKQYGDPRGLHSKTGDWLVKGDQRNGATELIAFPTKYNALSPYGVPRWIGNLPSVLGSRAAEEINLLYFDNKTIPPLVITVSGGVLTNGTITRIRQILEHEIKGRENFHNALILEAAIPEQAGPSSTNALPRIEVKPLTDQQMKDAMFMAYDDANRNKIRSSFRLAPLLTGESQDYTRATAEASLRVCEEQVFRPERTGFDKRMNRWVLPDLDARYWRMVSNGPNVTQNEDLIAALASAEIAGGMTPNLARSILGDVLERDVPAVTEPWGDLPFTMTMAQLRSILNPLMDGSEGNGDGGEPNDDEDPAKRARRALAALVAKRLPAELRAQVLRDAREMVRKELRKAAR